MDETFEKPEFSAPRSGRRAILAVGGLPAAGLLGAGAYHQDARRARGQAQVFIARTWSSTRPIS